MRLVSRMLCTLACQGRRYDWRVTWMVLFVRKIGPYVVRVLRQIKITRGIPAIDVVIFIVEHFEIWNFS